MPIPLGILAVAGAGAGVASDYTLISTQILSSSASSITFSSIPQTFKHLQLRAVLRTTAAGNNANISLNGDITGGNYVRHLLSGDGSSVVSSAQTGGVENFYAFLTATSSAQANGFGVGVCDILDYANTNKNTTMRSLTGRTNTDGSNIALRSGLWLNTAAVTSITIGYTSDLAANSRISLYGIK